METLRSAVNLAQLYVPAPKLHCERGQLINCNAGARPAMQFDYDRCIRHHLSLLNTYLPQDIYYMTVKN